MRPHLSAMILAACASCLPNLNPNHEILNTMNENAAAPGSVKKMGFGKLPDGTPIDLYVLTNGRITAKVMTYGAILTELDVPDKQGKTTDVVLGFEDLEGYLAGHPYFGSTVGRVANRVAGANSRSTARNTSSRPITALTPFTAA